MLSSHFKKSNLNTFQLIVFLSYVVALSFTDVAAQEVNIEYTYKHYTIHDGLAQMQVMSLFQDSKGYLWCYTKAGLSRFDGKHFKNFTKGVSLPGFDITTMGESTRGNLLIFGSFNFGELIGDSVIHHNYPEKSTSFSFNQHSTNKKLKEIHETKPNQQVETKIFSYANPDSIQIYPIDNSLGDVLYLAENDEDLIWQSNGDSISVSNLKTQRLIKKIANPEHLTKLKRVGNDLIGINKNLCLYKLIDNEFKLLSKFNTPSRYFKMISTPANDALIIKTDKDLFYYKDKVVPIKRNLTQIRDILFDNEENLWVATEEGLYNFFQLNFTNYTFGMGNKDWVWSVMEDEENNMWFASYQNGLWKWDGKSIADYTEIVNSKIASQTSIKPIPAHYRFYMGASKIGSSIYFPTECNVLKYEDKKFTPVEGLVDLPFQITKSLDDGTLLCGGFPGLFEQKPTGETKFWSRDSLKVSSVLSVEKENHIVVVGKEGVAVIKQDTILHYNEKFCQHSYCTTKDHRNNIWIAGLENVNLYTNDSLIHVSQKGQEAYYSALFVKPHHLLLGGLKGLYVVNLNDFYENGIFEMILFNQNSGFTGIECGQNGFFTDSEGFVWIPTSDLVSRFDPKKLINKKIQPPNLFVKTEVSSDNINWNTKSFDTGYNLKYSSNNLRFVVEAASFANIGNIRYYYRLKGLHSDWSDASETNEISFYNLRPGKYQFMAKADPGISKATSETIYVDFEIGRPYWLKWWFLIALSVFILSLFVLIIQYFRKKEQKKAITRQRLTQLRSEALSAQLDPHFVMNCLNNISGLVHAGYKKQAGDYIVKFSRLLRVILESVKKEAISLNAELEMVKKYMELEQFRCDDCFSYDITLPKNYSTENIMVPPMILQPLVENSIIHGFKNMKDQNAKIEIIIAVSKQNLQFIISDNGKGIQSHTPSGTGLGTKITRERIELLQQKNNIKFNTKNKEQGVEVFFEMPLVLKGEVKKKFTFKVN